MSLAHWNQDEEYGGFGGPHAMVPGGYGALTDALAARLLDVRLNSPVASIAYDGDSVQVKTAAGAPLLPDHQLKWHSHSADLHW